MSRVAESSWSTVTAHDREVGTTTIREASRVLRILLVDDNVDAVEMLAEILRGMGHDVDIGHDAYEAFAAAVSRPPDLAILDIGLPEIDGYELARQLRTLPALASTTLVALTGYGSDADRAHAIAAGFDRHVTKPISLETLRAVLELASPEPSARMVAG